MFLSLSQLLRLSLMTGRINGFVSFHGWEKLSSEMNIAICICISAGKLPCYITCVSFIYETLASAALSQLVETERWRPQHTEKGLFSKSAGAWNRQRVREIQQNVQQHQNNPLNIDQLEPNAEDFMSQS